MRLADEDRQPRRTRRFTKEDRVSLRETSCPLWFQVWRMLIEIIAEAWVALKRNITRSLLTMLGIVWGIATVTLLIAYGSSFRSILVHGFDAFGKSVVICWPQQTSEQPGGQRAGKKVVLEQADLDMVKATAPLVKHVCLETVRRPGIAYGDRMVGTAPVRGVCPEYGEMRNEVPDGRALDQCRGRTGAAARDLPRRPVEGTTLQRPSGGRRNRASVWRALHGDRRDGAEDCSSAITSRATTIPRGFPIRPQGICGTRVTQPSWSLRRSLLSSRKRRWHRYWPQWLRGKTFRPPIQKLFKCSVATNSVPSSTR